MAHHPRTASDQSRSSVSREKEAQMAKTIEDRIASVIRSQHVADEAYAAIEQDFPEAWARLENIRKLREEAEKLKADIRQDLIAASDFEVRQIEGFNVSVSRTVRLKVGDVNAISKDYKTPTKTKWDVDVKKAVEDAKILQKVPEGFVDDSLFRLNWNEVKNA